MPELSAEARAEIQAAIKIVREDKQHAMLRDIHTRTAPKTDPPADPPKLDAKGNPLPSTDPPPPTDPADPPKKRRTGWWDPSLFAEDPAEGQPS
jgi:hypothetical protein